MISTRFSTYGVFILRLSLGVMFIAHALLKLQVYTLPGTARYFEAVGYSGFLAYVVFGVELVGGMLLVVGVYTRWISLALTPVLIGAMLVHLPNGWVFSAPNGGWEYPAFLTTACVAQALLGDGALAMRTTASRLWRRPA